MEAAKTGWKVEKRGPFGYVDGKPYPRVTSILEIKNKPAIQYWYGREVWRAMNADPTLSEKEALAVPYKINDSSKSRGSTVHSIVEAYKHTREHIEGIPENFRGYAEAFYSWCEDYRVTIVEHEHDLFSPKYGYCGTLDLLVNICGGSSLFLIDVKTGKDIYPEVALQLSAYRQALAEEGMELEGTGALLLNQDEEGNGSYKYQFPVADCFRAFFACKVLWEWEHSEEFTKTQKYVKGGNR